jgi:uncharacterized protein YdhG (YjbR/CyaY superfamily)
VQTKDSRKDPRIDEYIGKQAEFAKKILTRIRKLILREFPELRETVKWGFPNYTFEKKIVCYMAGFKNHCAFGLREYPGIEAVPYIEIENRTAMGNLGRLTSTKDLPDDAEITTLISRSIAYLRDHHAPKKPSAKKLTVIKVPDDLQELLWITDAKTQTTRTKRMAQAVEWMAEGKDRNWKYRK